MKKRKLYVVKFSISCKDDFAVVKVFASKLRAQQYVESECKNIFKDKFNPSYGCWEDDLNYVYDSHDEHCWFYYWELEETDVDDGVQLPFLPEIEEENLALKEENNELRKQLAHVKGLNLAAQCYLTMWDGGWKYAKEHVVENMHKARAVLEDNEKGNDLVLKMFENWQESKCKACKKDK